MDQKEQKEKTNGLLEAKKALIEEINALGIENLHVQDLNLLPGSFVNLEYRLSNGQTVKLLEDDKMYWGNQVEIPGNGCASTDARERIRRLSFTAKDRDKDGPETGISKKRRRSCRIVSFFCVRQLSFSPVPCRK